MVVVLVFLVSFVSAVDVDQEVYDALESGDEVSVIVVLKDEPVVKNIVNNNRMGISSVNNLENRKKMINNVQDKVLSKLELKDNSIKNKLNVQNEKKHDLDLKHQYSIINGFSGKITKEGLQKLIDGGMVEKIEYDRPITINLQESVPLINATQIWDHSVDNININGNGEVICVIDTGIDYTQSYFGDCTSDDFLNGNCSKVVGGYDIADNDNNPIDTNGHGSNVAGIVASNDSTYTGVAPAANLIAMKVFPGSSRSTNTSNVISGIQWCLYNSTLYDSNAPYNISVMTLSLGDDTEQNTYCDGDSLAQSVNNVVSYGIFVSVASGNNVYSSGISAPACASNVTSVGAVYDSTGTSPSWVSCGGSESMSPDKITCFSNSGLILDILAPGAVIDVPSYTGYGGTSQATPHVAGAAALLQQYNKLLHNVSLTPQEIEDTLKNTGKQINDTRNGLNFSRIDVFAAIVSLDSIAPVINFTAPTEDNDSTIYINYTFINITSDETLQSALLEWNGTNQSMDGSGTNFYLNKSINASGTYTFRVFGIDYADNTNVTELRTLTYNTDPTVTITSPTNNSFHNTYFNLNISIEDDNISTSNYNITNSSSSIFQSNSNTSIAQSTFSWTDLVNISNSTFFDGNYSLTVFANDTSGGSTVSSVNFIVDKTNPALFAIIRTPTIAYNNDTVVFRINVTDTYLNTSTIELESNFSGSWENYTMVQEVGDTYNYTLTGTSNLTNQNNISYLFHAYDYVGNENSSSTYSFIVQNRVPTNVNITSPANNSVQEIGELISFTSNAVDLDNDDLTYTWLYNGTTTVGQNSSLQFNYAETFDVVLNVTDGYNYSTDQISVVINDTKAPTIDSTYDSEVHLEADSGSMTLNIVTDDYSGINVFNAYFDNISLETNSSYCDDTTFQKDCSWTITFEAEDVGSHNITINSTDGFTPAHLNSTVFEVDFVSCSDGVDNGDETDTDCGGSCSACSTSGDDSSSSSSSSGGGGGGGTPLTVSTTDDADDLDDSSSSSSGSSGGSTSTEPIVESVPEPITEKKTVSFTKDESKIVTIDESQIAVSSVEIESSVDKEVVLEVTYHPTKPEPVLELADTYQYLEVKSDLLNEEIEEAKIVFKVPLSWLTDNNYLEETVVLNHYEDDKWDQLDTDLIDKDDTELTFEAEVEHFSYFAITASTEMQLSWWKIFIPPKFGSKGFIIFGLVIFIIFLLGVYLVVKES